MEFMRNVFEFIALVFMVSALIALPFSYGVALVLFICGIVSTLVSASDPLESA